MAGRGNFKKGSSYILYRIAHHRATFCTTIDDQAAAYCAFSITWTETFLMYSAVTGEIIRLRLDAEGIPVEPVFPGLETVGSLRQE